MTVKEIIEKFVEIGYSNIFICEHKLDILICDNISDAIALYNNEDVLSFSYNEKDGPVFIDIKTLKVGMDVYDTVFAAQRIGYNNFEVVNYYNGITICEFRQSYPLAIPTDISDLKVINYGHDDLEAKFILFVDYEGEQ